MMQMNLPMKQTHRHKKRHVLVKGEEGGER